MSYLDRYERIKKVEEGLHIVVSAWFIQ